MAVFSALLAQYRAFNTPKLTIRNLKRCGMVGDEFGDVQERIENSKALVQATKLAASQSRRLVSDAKQWLDGYRAGEVKGESGSRWPGTHC